MTRVLVPLAVLEGESVSPGLIDLLSTVDVTVLGYHVLPEQTAPDQARLQYGERATAAIEDVVEEFHAAGGDADHRLVFTHDREQTIRRVAGETGSTAYVVPGATGEVDRLLVSLSGDVDADRVLSFVVDLVDGRDVGVTLVLATPAGATDDGDSLAEPVEFLSGRGIDVRTEHRTDTRPYVALIDALPGHDAVVMGERAPSLRSLLLGDEAERVAAESVGPVLVVSGEGRED